MTYHELMLQELPKLLELGETLRYPIYGTLRQGTQNWFGYFGLTEEHLLIAILAPFGKRIEYTTRIPLDVKSVKIKKSFVPMQYKVRVDFHEGNPLKMNVSRKVFGMAMQEENLEGFFAELQGLEK